MKTAMQELFDELEKDGSYWPKDLRVKWLEKERQQTIDAFNQGYREGESCGELMDMHDGDVSQFQDAEIYFKNTFNYEQQTSSPKA